MVIQQTSPKSLNRLPLLLCLVLAVTAESSAQDRADAGNALAGEAFGTEAVASADAADATDQVDVVVSRDGIVEMHIQDGKLYVVLQQLLLKSRRNIVFGRDVSGSVTVSLYNVTTEQALDAILKPNGFGYRTEGNFIYVYTQEDLDKILDEERILVTRTFRLNYISPTDAAKFIEPLLTSEAGSITLIPLASGGLSAGGTGGDAQSLAIEDIIMVRDYEENFWAVEKILAEIDKRPKQVLVEATILRATLNEANALGIDFNVLGGIDFQMLAAADGRSGLIPNTSNSALGASQNQSGTGTGSVSGALSLGRGTRNLGSLNNNVPISKLDDLTLGIGTNFAANVPTGGLTFGIVTDHVSAFIRALESVADVTVLSNPKVLTLNKQEAHVLVGSRDGFLTTSVTTETSTTQSVDYLETGTQLRFRPFISNDGYVRMVVTPSDSTGGVDARGLPFERTTEVTTNIMVKDGHTILIGGLFRDVSSTGRSQIPGLGSLPIIGPAFRSTNDSTIREEVIILLTVHIIEDESEYAAYSEEVLDDMGRLRVGIRESMQFHGRERLAQANYQKAVEYANQGEWDKAEWHCKLAIHNRPSFVDAIKLREVILGERTWDHEGTTTRNFIHNAILRKQGSSTPLYDRPKMPKRKKKHLYKRRRPKKRAIPAEDVKDNSDEQPAKPVAIQVSAPDLSPEDPSEYGPFLDPLPERPLGPFLPEECEVLESYEFDDLDDCDDSGVSADLDPAATNSVAPEDQVCEGDE